MKIIILFIMTSTFLFNGCISSTGDYAKGWVGHSIKEKEEKQAISHAGSYAKSIGWKEKIYKLDNGNLVYVEPDRPGCFIHWEVNPQGIIIGYKLEGTFGEAVVNQGDLGDGGLRGRSLKRKKLLDVSFVQ